MEITNVDEIFVHVTLTAEEARLLAKVCESAYCSIGGTMEPEENWPESVAEREPIVALVQSWKSAFGCAALASFALGNSRPPNSDLTLETIMARSLAVNTGGITSTQDRAQ